MNRLELRYEPDDEQLTLRPWIDGRDLLADYDNDLGLDPHQLLPPVSALLLPTRSGHATLIGCCGCGEMGCGSLSTQIMRIGAEVVWAPLERPPYETLARTYRFDLQHYLDAVDDAADNPPAGEGRGRRVSRLVRVLLGHHDQAYESLLAFRRGTVDWISAWPWTSDVVRVSLNFAGRQEILEFAAAASESDDNFAARVAAQLDEHLLPSDLSAD